MGQISFNTGSYYLKQGYAAQIQLQKPIDADFIERNRRMGKWINENAIIPLYGIMHHHRLLERIDQSAVGWKEVDLMRRMRHAFTKTHLNYRPNSIGNQRLQKEVVKYFNLDETDWHEGEIPTPINTAVERLFRGCREYVHATYNHALHNAPGAASRPGITSLKVTDGGMLQGLWYANRRST